MDKDYYKILGVTESDSAEEIKIAYRKLARKWHPDIAGNSVDVILRFKEINEAYQILSDKVKKTEYDKARRFYNYAQNGYESDFKNGNSEQKKNTSSQETFTKPNFKNFFSGWEDFVHNKKRETQEHKNNTKTPKKGNDIYADIEISVLEAVNGTTKVINLLQTNACPYCGGRKFINGSSCWHCNGKGEVTHHKKFSVKIPAGIKNKSKIRLSGEGENGLYGGENGDLYITVNIIETNYITDGLNIIKTIQIAPHEAVLGTNIKIKSINGTYNVKIAPNTQNNQKIRLSGCGIVQNDKVGDMIIVLEIKIPKNISKEELELYKKLAELSSKKIQDTIYEL